MNFDDTNMNTTHPTPSATPAPDWAWPNPTPLEEPTAFTADAWPFTDSARAEKISHVRVVLTQDKDCCDMGDDVQEMTVTVEDGGGGPFLVIDTQRWALDLTEIDRFIAKLRKIQDLYEGF